MPVRALLAFAALAVALFVPAAAHAQAAGDEQYADPFGEQTEQQATPTATPAPAPAQAQATPAQATPAPTAAPVARAATAAAPQARQLPYTGADAGLLALAGTVLLAAGVALRLRADRQR